ncbi:MAG: peptide chain release factor 3 [Bacilli bacterium]|nr:peptide chain release factor 3 [Bacilli bacterium]
MAIQELTKQVSRRRTFAIISHPDAGKTTLTEKLLLFGGAIREAGSIKGRKAKSYARSDWMEIEKQRGISVTSSVLQFSYEDFCVNILDTPGHEDFSEDTYRTLTAADSAVMLIDAAKGVEPQTIKLFQVCKRRGIPIFTFINKLDRQSKDPFELLDEISDVLGIRTYPINWPVGMGKDFKGIFDRRNLRFEKFDRANMEDFDTFKVSGPEDPQWQSWVEPDQWEQMKNDIELLDGAGDAFSPEDVLQGELSPVFFGSAVANFGVRPFLETYLKLSPSPVARNSTAGVVEPTLDKFSGFIFKIQANMNPAHRDRIAFLRICSGRFERGMAVTHVRTGRSIRLAQPQQFLAQDRTIVEEAYAGDIIGIHDPGAFRIGDTLCEGQQFEFEGIPQFSPEHFAKIEQKDTMKYKQFQKGISELVEEGVMQLFQPAQGPAETILGVVGPLQLEVLQHRLRGEYGVEITMTGLPYTSAFWMKGDEASLRQLQLFDCRMVKDMHGTPVGLFKNEWTVQRVRDQVKGLELSETAPR